MALNKRQKQLLTEYLLKFSDIHSSRLDEAHNRHRTHKARKSIASEVYKLTKAVDIILDKLHADR